MGTEPSPYSSRRYGIYSKRIPVCHRAAGSIDSPDWHPVALRSLFRSHDQKVPWRRRSPGYPFLALLKGDALVPGITITGTVEATGQIGPTSHVKEKTKAAALAGYRVLLVPRRQFYTPRANLVGMGIESKVLVYEVGTIDEAYTIMTGKRL